MTKEMKDEMPHTKYTEMLTSVSSIKIAMPGDKRVKKDSDVQLPETKANLEALAVPEKAKEQEAARMPLGTEMPNQDASGNLCRSPVIQRKRPAQGSPSQPSPDAECHTK